MDPQKTAAAPQTTAVAPQTTAVAPQTTAVAPGQAAPDAPRKNDRNPGDTVTAGGKTYKIEKILGQGSEGDLLLVSEGKRQYALKIFHKGFRANTGVLGKLSPLKGKGYLVELVDYGDDFELMQYLPEGSAASLKIKGDAKSILAIAVKTALSLDSMHAKGVIHKDIKPANILMTDKGTLDCVLCDFGIADILDKEGKCSTRQARTPIYAAPEVYSTNSTVLIDGVTYCSLTPKADFYSLGMTILSLWMGEGAFMSKENEFAILKNGGGITVPAEMPDPLNKICRGLLVKNPAKRWGLSEITRTMKGEDVPVEDEDPETEFKVVFSGSKNQIAHSPEELAAFMMGDRDLATKYLYRGDVEKWLKPYPELELAMQEIVETRYPKDKVTGLDAAVFALDPTWPLKLKGNTRKDGKNITASATTLKDVSNFCNGAIMDEATMKLIASATFRAWVRIRDSRLADKLPVSKRWQESALLRIQTIDPLSDIGLRNDPSDPDYAMTQEGIGHMIQYTYNLWWSFALGDKDAMLNDLEECARTEGRNEDFLEYPDVIYGIAACFDDPKNNTYLRDFFKTKGDRFDKQLKWFEYCTDWDDPDYVKKAGPKDNSYRSQVAMMRTVKGYGCTPLYYVNGGDEIIRTRDDMLALKTSDLKVEYERRGLAGWLAVQHHENPDADLSKQFTYENLLKDYLDDLRLIDGGCEPARRFDFARKVADRVLADGKAKIRDNSARSTFQFFTSLLLGLIPGLILLAYLIFTIIENPVLDTSGLQLDWLWTVGIILGIIFLFADGIFAGIIVAVVVGLLVQLLVKFVGAVLLYVFAVVLLGAIIFFSIKTVFKHSSYARDARKFNKPGFEEKVLEPLYFAFSDENSFDTSLNAAFSDTDIACWRDDIKDKRKFILMFIGTVIAAGALMLIVPKSDRASSLLHNYLPQMTDGKPADLLTCPSLETGAQGEDVVLLQGFLKDAGYLSGAADGDYGDATRRAVRKFQKANGLKGTGVCDSLTISTINRLAAEAALAAQEASLEQEAGTAKGKKH